MDWNGKPTGEYDNHKNYNDFPTNTAKLCLRCGEVDRYVTAVVRDGKNSLEVHQWCVKFGECYTGNIEGFWRLTDEQNNALGPGMAHQFAMYLGHQRYLYLLRDWYISRLEKLLVSTGIPLPPIVPVAKGGLDADELHVTDLQRRPDHLR